MAANDETGIIFEGVVEFERSMYELSVNLPEKVVRRGLRAGGEVIQAAVTLAAPVRDPRQHGGNALPPGALKSDIGLKVIKEADGSFSAVIAPGKHTAWVARLVEYGHELVVGGRKGKGGTTIGKVPAHPFFRPAFESSEQGAMMVAEETILEAIEQEAQKIGFTSGTRGLLGA